MGAAQSIPVIGEIVTVLDSGTRTIAAGVCEVVGDDKDAKELIKGAGNSWKHYSEVNLLVANARVVYYKARGDEKDAHDILKKEGEAWTDIGENTPGVGHVVSLVRYVEGDKEGAKRAFMAATRSTLVVAATVATGGVGGAAVAAGAAALTGIAADGVMTGINSLDEHKFAPVGTFAGVAQAGKSKSVNDWITAAEIPIGDAVSGAVQGGLRTTISRPKPFPMVATAADQIPMETLKSNSHTAHFVQEFDNAEAALSHLKNKGDQKYNFVQLANGKIRVISHNDIAEASNHITNQGSAGHSSLVEPGHPVHAAGELHIQDGFVKNINCQSGHYRVPLRYMARQLDTAFPQEFLTFRSPGMARVMRRLQGGKDKSKSYPDMKDIAIYSPHLLVIGMTHNKELVTLHNAHYAVAFHENNHVTTIGLADQRSAQAVYDNLPDDYTKALIKRREAKVLSSHGDETRVQECKNEVEKLKSFIVMDGLHLTVPLQEAPYIVSFYRKDCVKMVGCPNREFGQKVFKHIDQKLAKVLVDRHSHKVLDSSVGNGDQKQIEQCKDHVMKLPGFNDAVPLEGAPWILLWYRNNSVQAIGFHGVEAAEAAYNALSPDYPKILGEKGKSNISKSSGNIDRCKESLSMLRSITQALPLPNARFVTATHMGDHVRLIGFPTYDAATVFHNVSNRDRIVFDRRISQKLRAHLHRDDDQRWINLCEMRAKQLPELREIDIPYGQYLVVVHFKDHVYMIALPDENSAKNVFEGIDNYWSGILVDGQGKTLLTKGGNYYIELCNTAVRELIRLRTTVSLQDAQYIVAYHDGSCARLIGFDKGEAARNFHDAMSKNTVRVIAKRGDGYSVASHPPDSKVEECTDEILKYFPLEIPKKAAVESPDRPPVKIDDNNGPNTGTNEESNTNSDNEPDVDDGSDNEPSTQDNGDNESNDDDEPDAEGNGSDESDVENNDDSNAEVSSNEGGNSDEEENDESQEDQSDDMDPSEDQSLDGSDQESELSQNDDDGGEPGMSDSDNKSLEGSEQDEEEENQDQSNSENDDVGNGSATDTVDDPDQEAEDDADGVESDAENNDGEVDDAGSNEDGDQEEKNEMNGSEVEEDNNSETDEVDPTEDEPVEGFNSGDSDRDQSDNNSENGNGINDEEASDLDQDGNTNDAEGESGEDAPNDDESANASDQEGESENQPNGEDDESQDEGENEEEGGEEEEGEGGEDEGREDEGGEDEGGEDDEANDDQDQNEEPENDDQDDNSSGAEEGSTNENDEPEYDDEEANGGQDQNEEEDGVEDQDNENELGDDFDDFDEGEDEDAQEADMQEEDNEDNEEDTNDYDQEGDENNDEDTNDYDQENDENNDEDTNDYDQENDENNDEDMNDYDQDNDEDNGAQEDENDYDDQNNDDYGEENMDGMDQGGDGQEYDMGDSNNDYEDNGEQDYD